MRSEEITKKTVLWSQWLPTRKSLVSCPPPKSLSPPGSPRLSWTVFLTEQLSSNKIAYHGCGRANYSFSFLFDHLNSRHAITFSTPSHPTLFSFSRVTFMWLKSSLFISVLKISSIKLCLETQKKFFFFCQSLSFSRLLKKIKIEDQE